MKDFQDFVQQLYDGRRTFVRAMCDIKCGEELTATYGPRFGETTRRERQEYLRNGYHFICDCQVNTRQIELATMFMSSGLHIGRLHAVGIGAQRNVVQL